MNYEVATCFNSFNINLFYLIIWSGPWLGDNDILAPMPILECWGNVEFPYKTFSFQHNSISSRWSDCLGLHVSAYMCQIQVWVLATIFHRKFCIVPQIMRIVFAALQLETNTFQEASNLDTSSRWSYANWTLIFVDTWKTIERQTGSPPDLIREMNPRNSVTQDC
jgi:hypothetical protein